MLERGGEMQYQEVDSSSIAAVAYDARTMTLGIRFHGQREYHYSRVPAVEYQQLLTTESIGRYFVKRIRNEYTAIRTS